MNDYEAFKLALTLGITASTDEDSQQCVKLANQIAPALSLDDIELAKLEVERELELIGDE